MNPIVVEFIKLEAINPVIIYRSFMLEIIDRIFPTVAALSSSDRRDSVFIETSSYFYHENFHSDLLAYYLNKEEPRKIFINWLNSLRTGRSYIDYERYRGGRVFRESHRIDITLLSDDGRRAIIIENKSNDACEQTKQVFRYYKKLSEEDKATVDCILYLNKRSLNKPDLGELSPNERLEIEELIEPAQLMGERSFSESVLEKVILITQDIRLNALSQELRELFLFLVNGKINMEIMNNFVEELKKGDNRQKLEKCIEAYKVLPDYLTNHYREVLLDLAAGKKVMIWKECCLVIEDALHFRGQRFSVDVWFDHARVDFSIFTRKGSTQDVEDLKKHFGDTFPFSRFIDGRYRFFIDDILDTESIIAGLQSIMALGHGTDLETHAG